MASVLEVAPRQTWRLACSPELDARRLSDRVVRIRYVSITTATTFSTAWVRVLGSKRECSVLLSSLARFVPKPEQLAFPW